MALEQPPGYSLENAAAFGWNSVSGDLLPSRVELLEKYLIGPAVLDAGCGGGAFVDYMTGRGFDASGVDKYEMFLDIARKRGYKGKFFQADLSERIPFADGAFDTTVCFDVLEHVADDRRAIRELARVTRRRLILAVPQEDRWMPRYRLSFYPYRDPTHLRYYTPESLRELSESLGPVRVDVFGEQEILVQDMAADLLEPRSRYAGLSGIYQRLFRFLVNRNASPPLYMNLAAIIDISWR